MRHSPGSLWRWGGLVLLGLILVVIMVLTSCQSDSDSDKVSVTTTFYPLQYLARRIGGDRVEVKNLVPPGTEPHDWEPKPSDVASIRKSKVFVYHGAGLEAWAKRVVRDLPKGGPLPVEATQSFALRPGIPEDGEKNEGPGVDPHVWLDPQLYARQAELVEAALAKADPEGASVYAANLAALRRDLEMLDGQMSQGLASCKQRTIVSAHASIGYLAERYKMQQLPISGISPDAEPSPARLREIVAQLRSLGTTHIFFETLVNPAVSEAIAKEVGARTLVFNPLEGLTQEEIKRGETYLTVMQQNLANLRTGLSCP